MFFNESTCRASLHYSSKDTYGGSVMFTIWNPIACQGKSSTGNCGRAPDAWADLSFTLRMFASMTYDSLNSIPIPGRSSRLTTPPDVTVWRRGNSGLRRRPGPRWRPGPRQQSSGRRERNDKYQFVRPPTTSVPAATKTATQESGFWVTQEPVDTDALTITSPRRGCHIIIEWPFNRWLRNRGSTGLQFNCKLFHSIDFTVEQEFT